VCRLIFRDLMDGIGIGKVDEGLKDFICCGLLLWACCS